MNIGKLCIIFLFCPIWIFGQFSEAISVNECSICSPSVLKGDLDNDGNLDIVVSSFYGGNKLVWYRNLGNFLRLVQIWRGIKITVIILFRIVR